MNSTAKHRRLLIEVFLRNGNIRHPDALRRRELGSQYKKGAEVRLVAYDRTELRQIRRALHSLGFRMGQPFTKGHQFVQPIYGVEQVRVFAEMLSQAH